MPNITPNDIQNIRDFDTLLGFFRDKLDWHIPEDVELEDVAFPWSPEELDLDEPTEDRIVDCRQLPPFGCVKFLHRRFRSISTSSALSAIMPVAHSSLIVLLTSNPFHPSLPFSLSHPS